MKIRLNAHPLMILMLIKPFLFILIIPVIKILLEFLIYKKATAFLFLEIIAVLTVVVIGILRWKSYSLEIENAQLTIENGIFFRKTAVLPITLISTVEVLRDPIDRLFGAVTYEINTEAGLRGRADFKFKLKKSDSHRLSAMLYGKTKNITFRFSAVKLAILAATTSSAITGLIISIPLIKRLGDLIGKGVGEMLFDRLNSTAENAQTFFPPIVNLITMIFVLLYLVAFIYAFLSFLRFEIKNDDEKIIISAGVITTRRNVFKKSAVKDIRIEQTPLMHFLGLYSLYCTVGGFGDAKKEKATVMPCAKRKRITLFLQTLFNINEPKQNKLSHKRNKSNKNRFLFKPMVFSAVVIALVVIAVAIFDYFDRLMLFLMIVSQLVILYYADLCIYNYHNAQICFEKGYVSAAGIYGFNTRQLIAKKENIGEIKLIRYPNDMRRGTCKVKLTVRSQSADRIRLLNIDYKKTKETIYKEFSVE